MNATASGARVRAAKVAAWLISRQRVQDAVELLSAWAARSGNDPEGQKLLADALRVNQGAPIAKMAFERMQGIDGDHALLDEAIRRYDDRELLRLEREMSTGAFRRAQVGYNDNLKYRGRVYHIQTEDSGIDKPQIVTHLFADGGRVLKSYKRSYLDAIERPDIDAYVRALMKAQQMEMASALREGKLDGVIDGREAGGVEVLTHPPNVEVQRFSHKGPVPTGVVLVSRRDTDVTRTPVKPSSIGKVRFTMYVLRSLTGGPEEYSPPGDEVIIGASGGVSLPGERFCHPREAIVRYRNGRLLIEDIDGGNGVFLRIRRPVELSVGDEFIVGDQLLRIERNPDPDDHPDPDPTYFWSSPKQISPFRIVQIFEGGAPGACVMARGTTLQIGAAVGDLVFPNDPLVSDYHCLVEEQAGAVVLTDLASRTGVFVRIQGHHEIRHGDEILVGRTRLLVDLSAAAAGRR
jgi:hypothetical protein